MEALISTHTSNCLFLSCFVHFNHLPLDMAIPLQVEDTFPDILTAKNKSMAVRGQVSRWLELGLRFDCKRLHEEKLTGAVDYLSISI